MINYDELVTIFIQEFPEFNLSYKDHLEYNVVCLPHVFFGDEVNNILIRLIQEECNSKLMKVFSFFERMAIIGDKDVKNLLAVTILARLGDDTYILKKAFKYMGENTKKILKEIESHLGRNYDFSEL